MFNKIKEKIKEFLQIFLKIEIVVRHVYEFPTENGIETKEVIDGKDVEAKIKPQTKVVHTFIGKKQDIKVQSNNKITLC